MPGSPEASAGQPVELSEAVHPDDCPAADPGYPGSDHSGSDRHSDPGSGHSDPAAGPDYPDSDRYSDSAAVAAGFTASSWHRYNSPLHQDLQGYATMTASMHPQLPANPSSQ